MQIERRQRTKTIRCWEEVSQKIDDSLKYVSHTALFVHNAAEIEDITAIFKNLHSSKVLYISMTRTYDAVKASLPLLASTTIFVDCISGGVFLGSPPKNCLFKPMPADVPGLIKLIASTAAEVNPEHIIIDSISQFIDFTGRGIDREGYDLIQKLRSLTSKNLLLYDENMAQLTDFPTMLISSIYRIEVIRTKIRWEG